MARACSRSTAPPWSSPTRQTAGQRCPGPACQRRRHEPRRTTSSRSRGCPRSRLAQISGNVAAVLPTPRPPRRRAPMGGGHQGLRRVDQPDLRRPQSRLTVDTSGRPLTDSQLPIACGSTPPAQLSGARRLVAAVRRSRADRHLRRVQPCRRSIPAHTAVPSGRGALRNGFGIDLDRAIGSADGRSDHDSDRQTADPRRRVSDPASGQPDAGQRCRSTSTALSPSTPT